MKFLEFAGTNTVAKLVDIAKDPNMDPKLKDEVLAILKQIEAKDQEIQPEQKPAVPTDQPTKEAVGDDVVSKIESDEDYFQRLLNSDPRLKAIAEKKIKEAEAAAFNLGKALSTDTKTERIKKAKELATRLGKPSSWANTLVGALSLYDDQLEKDFLELCVAGQGLTNDITKGGAIAKFNLKTAINPKLAGIFENKEAFEALLYLPFAEQKAGFGGGVGPGEALLAMLIPNAKRASPGDIQVGNKTWEIKSGSYSSPSKGSSAWLDSAPGKLTGNSLRKIFDDTTSQFIRPMLQKTVKVGENKFRVSQVLELADFRSKAFPYLQALFTVFTDDQKIQVIENLYSELFPTIQKKDKEFFDDVLVRSIVAIKMGDHQNLAKLQAKAGMLEYAVGSYQSSNFIIYNSTTHDILAIQGKKGILKSLDDSGNNLVATTITMGKSAKASAGVFLKTTDQEFLDKNFGFERKRQKITRS